MNKGVPIVIDNGTGFTKAGFAGAESPKSIFPTVIGTPKTNIQMVGGQNKDFFVGFEAQAKSDLLNLKFPIENGLINQTTNWEYMEKLWHHTFYNELLVLPEDHPVVLTEKPMCPRFNRERMIQIMFETFHVSGYYSGVQAVLALFSQGRTTGIVWDAGEGAGFVVPIYEGYGLPHAIMRSAISGHDITVELQKLLRKKGISEESLKLTDIQILKEQICTIMEDAQKDSQSKLKENKIQMPSGEFLTYTDEGNKAAEILFQPSLAGVSADSIHQLIFGSLEKCDNDVKKEMYSSIVLSGGTSMFPGLPKRMEKEVLAMAQPSMKVKVLATPERKNAVWIGGSVLGSLDAFPMMMIDRNEYKEEGSQIVHRKHYS